MDRDIILLIGMPGCGKSVIGNLLATKLNYEFCDMDKYIEEISGKSISDLFLLGEEIFRDFESKACLELSKRKKIVISSGGGIVKRKNNMDLFKDKGKVIFIDRPLEKIVQDIDIDSRPLLTDGKEKIYKLYNERYDLYNKYSSIRILNDRSIDCAINSIIKNI